MNEILARARDIRLVIFDVDGVLTDGRLHFDVDGTEYKAFHSRDGHGMKMLQRSGVDIAVITGRSSRIVTQRMQELGVEHVYQGARDKAAALAELLAAAGVTAQQAAYVGDDVVDLPAMVRVAVAIAVADAHPLVKRHAHWVTQARGGRGAAREVCEWIMAAQGKLDAELESYLK